MKSTEGVAPAILSVALLTVMAGAAIAPVIASIGQAFPDTRPEFIKLVLTLPPLMVIPFAMIAGRLTRVMGKKTVLLMGLILYLAGGVGGGFAGTIEILLLCRALLGLSVGLIMPISTALVSDFFDDNASTRMMGWISASNHFGGMAAQIISGILATICWRYAFGTYGIACIAIAMVFIYFPKDEKTEKVSNSKIKLPLKVYLYAGSIFVLMLVFYTVPINISFLIEKNGMGNAAISGLACSLITGSAFLVGIYFQRLHTAFKRLSVVVGIMLMATGFGFLYLADGIIFVFVGITCVGFGEGYLLPYVFHSTRTAVGIDQTVRAMAIITSMMYLGQFCSPIIIDSIGKHWMPQTQEGHFLVAFLLCISAATLALIQAIRFNKNKKFDLLPKEF